jgi:hypothetical protein
MMACRRCHCSIFVTPSRHFANHGTGFVRPAPSWSAIPDLSAPSNSASVSKRPGHAKPDITLRIYAHLFQKGDGKAAAAINTALNRKDANRVPISRFVLFGTCAKHLKVLVWKGGRVV